MSTIRIGNCEVSTTADLYDSTSDYKNEKFEILRARLDADGYLLLRGIIPITKIISARMKMLSYLAAKNAIEGDIVTGKIAKDNTGKLHTGWTIDAESGNVAEKKGARDSLSIGWAEIGNSRELIDVYNGDSLKNMYKNVIGAHTTLPHCTWLRAKGHGEVTAEHCDYYYFRNETNIFRKYLHTPMNDNHAATLNCMICCGDHEEEKGLALLCDICDLPYHQLCTQPLVPKIPKGEWHCNRCADLDYPYWTCWIALGNISREHGRLALLPGTHKLKQYNQPSRPNLTPGEYTASFERKSIWYTTTFAPGDIVLFNIKLIHAATQNYADAYRLSCDTRVTASKRKRMNTDCQTTAGKKIKPSACSP